MSGTEHARPPRDGTHQCPGPGCTRRVRRQMLACNRHWAMVDRHTQRRVYAAYRAGDADAHRQAITDAIEEMRQADQP